MPQTSPLLPTNLPGGVNNLFEYEPLGSLPFPVPQVLHTYFNDFNLYLATDWTVTETQAGATQAIVAGDGGILALVNTAGATDLNALQNPQETWRWASTKKMWLAARFKLSEVLQSDLIIGLYITDTSPLATLPSDGIFFHKADGSAALTFQARKDAASSSIALGNMVADTYVVAVAHWDGNQWTAWLDDARKGSITTTTNSPDDEDLAEGIAVQNGEALAKTLSVDYLLISKAR